MLKLGRMYVHKFIFIFSDSNKARQRIRAKIQKEKKQLVEAIASYNSLVSEEEAVGSVDTVLAEGHLWPWDNGMYL